MTATAQREIIQVEQKVPILKGIPLSLQHLFAMFGASVLVPILFNTWAGKVVRKSLDQKAAWRCAFVTLCLP